MVNLFQLDTYQEDREAFLYADFFLVNLFFKISNILFSAPNKTVILLSLASKTYEILTVPLFTAADD